MAQSVNFMEHFRDPRAMRLARWGPRVLLVAVVLAVATPLVLQRLVLQRHRLEQQANQWAQEVAAAVDEEARLRSEIARLTAPAKIARGVHANDARWLDLLGELRNRLPAEMWLSRLEVTAAAAGQGQTVRLEGGAASHDAVGRYLQSLCESPWLATPRLVRTGPTVAGANGITFELQAALRVPLPTYNPGVGS
ncbi:MAG: PilN domain-containing protein [Armatimonadetes bacterium]|nr:PilN domain-containing protein [Armatimonadota bacterium]